jgi:hypothetical protein
MGLRGRVVASLLKHDDTAGNTVALRDSQRGEQYDAESN